MRLPKFEVYQAANSQWAWRLKSANGEIVAQGETYKTKAGALRGVKAVTRLADIAGIFCDSRKPKSESRQTFRAATLSRQ